MSTTDKNSSKVPDFEHYIKINSKIFRYMGLTIKTEGNKRDRISQVSERLLTIINIIMCLMIGYIQVTSSTMLWNIDRDLSLKIITGSINNIVCLSKGSQIAYRREQLQTLFENLNAVWKKNCLNRTDEIINNKIIEEAQGTINFLTYYMSALIFIMAAFGIPPYISFFFYYINPQATNYTYDFNQRIFLIMYPFDINTFSTYFIIVLEETWVLFFSAVHWISCDTVFAQVASHAALQLKVLMYDMNIVTLDDNDEERIRINVVEIIRRHQELLNICDHIEYIFSPILLISMLFVAIHICFNLFQTREMILQGNYTELVLPAFHLLIIFFETMVYCNYAEKLTLQASLIADAAYNCRWLEKSQSVKQYFRVLIMKSQKPFYFTAYGFFTIDHERITNIVNTAMSYYLMLQTVNE